MTGGGAFLAGGLLIGGLPQVALGRPSAKQDAAILNFALLLEYLESEWTFIVPQQFLVDSGVDFPVHSEFVVFPGRFGEEPAPDKR